MWPFSSSYLTVVKHKCDQRAHALETAPPYAAEYQPFNKATGKLSANQTAGHHWLCSTLATEIVSRIKNKEWTATQVLEAYIARAKLAQAHTNCLTEGIPMPAVSLTSSHVLPLQSCLLGPGNERRPWMQSLHLPESWRVPSMAYRYVIPSSSVPSVHWSLWPQMSIKDQCMQFFFTCVRSLHLSSFSNSWNRGIRHVRRLYHLGE